MVNTFICFLIITADWQKQMPGWYDNSFLHFMAGLVLGLNPEDATSAYTR